MDENFGRRDIHLGNWREHPFSRWTFQNVAEFVPTALITERRESEPPAQSPSAFEAITLRASDGSERSAASHFAASHADSVVAMRGGAVVAQWNAPHADPARPHLIFSVSKSITGMLAGVAVADGALDPDAPVTTYVPEAAGSAFGTASVRHLLDMTTSLAFTEDYLDLTGDFDRYRRGMLWNPERADTTPLTAREVLCSLPIGHEPHGRRLHYASPNTDMLGLVIERAAGIRFATYLADRIWRPMGARGSALVTVDREGTARAAGGIQVTPHDLARFGQLILDDGRGLVPSGWIDDMRRNGDRQAWIDGDFSHMLAHGRYRSGWYAAGDNRGSFFAIGIHSQWIWIDPTSGIVIARTSSRPTADDNEATAAEIAAFGQLARVL